MALVSLFALCYDRNAWREVTEGEGRVCLQVEGIQSVIEREEAGHTASTVRTQKMMNNLLLVLHSKAPALRMLLSTGKVGLLTSVNII